MTDTPLAFEIKARIRRLGPITFHDFMRDALKEYYGKGPDIGGPKSEFTTSVSHPAFRAAVTRLVRELPAGWRVVELGAGTGELAGHVTKEVPGVEYITVDMSPGLRAKQSKHAGVRAVARCEDLAPAPSLVFGNEILDALPVSRVTSGPNGELYELLISIDAEGNFLTGFGPAVDPRLAARLQRIGIWPQRGQVLDVAPALEEFVRSAARLADPGILLFIDYGELAEALYEPARTKGSLMTYTLSGKPFDPLDDVGRCDITADVDFTAVHLAAADAGMESLGIITQESFLEALGVTDFGTAEEAEALGVFEVFAARRGTKHPIPGFE